MRSLRVVRALSLFAFLVVAFGSRKAEAGGFYLLDRGARALSRGGAFVAGADDPQALWYNPAGLAWSKNQIVGESTLTLPFVDYTRYTGDGASPTVHAKPMYIPIPSLAFSYKLSKSLTIGAGIFAPNMMLINWPRSIPGPSGTNLPAPTRYSLVSLQGSLLSNLAMGGSYKLTKDLSLGADFQVAAGRFKAETGLSACDGAICQYPEDPDFDAYATIDAMPVWGFTGTFGIIYNLFDMVRWGASVALPYKLSGTGSLDLKMPDNVLFRDAQVQGNKADLALNFPLIVRVGSEIRPVPYLRMEGAFVWEQWSSQKAITMTPNNMKLTNVSGIGEYEVGKVDLVRNMRDVWSLRGGYEIWFPRSLAGKFFKSINLAMRGGLAYETSAFDKHTLTPLTIDSDKLLVSGGFSFDLLDWLRMDTSAGWYHMWNQEITQSTIYQPTAIRPGFKGVSALGNGKYEMEAIYLGGSLIVKLE
jgi:long-chain fatty acid transport protein